MASIDDPNISPDQCINGLNLVRDGLTRFSPTDRQTAFAYIDDGFHHCSPKSTSPTPEEALTSKTWEPDALDTQG